MMWYRDTPFVLGDQKRAHLQVRGLSAGYGAFLVLRDLRFEVKPGLTVILGPNGAGKTTLLKSLMGLIPRQGLVLLDGEDLPEKTHEIVRGGMTLVAEGRQLFPQMSVLENLELGGWLVSKAERARRMEQVLADFPKLRERIHQRGRHHERRRAADGGRRARHDDHRLPIERLTTAKAHRG